MVTVKHFVTIWFIILSMLVFCERLKELRESKDLSLRQLASALGVSAIAVSRWETGQRTPSIEQLLKIANFFGVSSDYLIGLEN